MRSFSSGETSHVRVQGMVTLTLSAWVPGVTPEPSEDSSKWYQSAALFGSLYIVALGTGGIKPNVSAFGADQFDESDPQVRSTTMRGRARSCAQ
jgi:dipeptide/tripeptide permease